MSLDDRITEALRRITTGTAPMRIPADPGDPDLVLVECREALAAATAREAALRKALLDQAGSTKDGMPNGGVRPCWCDEPDHRCRNMFWCVNARAALASPSEAAQALLDRHRAALEDLRRRCAEQAVWHIQTKDELTGESIREAVLAVPLEEP